VKSISAPLRNQAGKNDDGTDAEKEDLIRQSQSQIIKNASTSGSD
jgi:hypothetical protein